MPTKSYKLTAEQQEKVFSELPDILRAKGYEVEVEYAPAKPTFEEYETARDRSIHLSELRLEAMISRRWEPVTNMKYCMINAFYWLNREISKYDRVIDAYFERDECGNPYPFGGDDNGQYEPRE